MWAIVVTLLVAQTGARPVAKPPPYCAATYATDFAALSKSAVEIASRPDTQFTYCLRNVATYECLSYAPDGTIRRARRSATSHGTAFAFRRQGGETYLLTNQHVAEYPPVSDEDHPVPGVPSGCKRVNDQLRLVNNEKDVYEADDVQLTRVATDASLDAAIVKAKTGLSVMPWRVGSSSALRERAVVEVRGFPLGAFNATVEGRVTSTFDHDDYREWDHDDFVVDALLSSGNSGSPVLAINCSTGEYELVGMYHAGYTRGSALNVVIHVDQLREMMTTLKRTTVARSDLLTLDGTSRKRLFEELIDSGRISMPFSTLVAEARPREDGAIVFSLYDRGYPTDPWPAVVFEDAQGATEAFGTFGRVWLGNARGLREVRLEALDPNDRLALEKSLELLRRLGLVSASRRRAVARSVLSREATEDVARLDKDLRKLGAQTRELTQALADLNERLAPGPEDSPQPPTRPFSTSPSSETTTLPAP